ncbi:hypothetical protein OPQ81_010529 [Rhizoctonia solani]|nr:hypothetical protein OPQ81_010529 [Rhizoctonia solani]
MNGAKIYVGNLSWNTNDETLRNTFSQYGNVLDSIVMRDRETGRSRGFGFVTYATEHEATLAISTANGTELDGRQIKVNLANARGASGGAPGGSVMYPQPGFGGGYGGFPPAGGYPSGAAPYGGWIRWISAPTRQRWGDSEASTKVLADMAHLLTSSLTRADTPVGTNRGGRKSRPRSRSLLGLLATPISK